MVVAGCGDSPVNYSAPVGINMKAKSGDVVQSVVTEKKAITTESSNPYGAFVNNAQQMLGRAPGRIEVDTLALILGADSTGVTGLEQVFTGEVDVLFIMNDTNNTYNVAHVMNPTGSQVPMTIDFDGAAVSSVDYPKMLNGSFSVVIRGPAAATFPGAGAQASLETNFTFAAFQ
jgi:hypothetical protein